MDKTTMNKIRRLGACSDAVAWLEEQETPSQAWADCQRGDWMLWILGKLAGEPGSDARRPLVLCACECARLALKYTDDPNVKKCIQTAEGWAKGKRGVTLEDVRAYAASAAASAAAYAAYAASAAAYAAAYAATYAAAYAASAAAYADYADYAADEKILNKCSDIVRKHYPQVPKL